MHQPLYIDPFSQEILLPFVRLHAIKDYYEMIRISDNYDSIHPIYNLVPSLIDQLNIYSRDKYHTKEKWLQLTIKSPKDLTQSDKLFIINNFFLGNPEQMIATIPHFNRLYHKALRTTKTARDGNYISRAFSDQEIMDIQVLHLLSWYGEFERRNNNGIIELLKKEKNYNEDEKSFIIDTHFEIIDKIIDLYKDSFLADRIEISTTPYYHPILPLLIDSDAGKSSSMKELPSIPYKFPNDALIQVQMAKEKMNALFEKEITGFWPSEGSLSNAVLDLFQKQGIKWVATDEGNLYKSKYNKEDKYFTPYNYDKIKIFFRNHSLSDKIGFSYSRWNSSLAVDDLISNIRKQASFSKSEYPLIPIILDGENCWEYYNNNGYTFLNELYSRISSEPDITSVTFNDYLDKYDNNDYKIYSLNPGSWINDNFDIWIGNPEENLAWSFLRDARQCINHKSKGYENLLIAQGSDWFWWYGDQHFSNFSMIFDRLFRLNLQKAYNEAGRKYNEALDKPIKKKISYRLYQKPKVYLDPIIDGKITNYYEWLNAGHINVSEDFGLGSLHQRNIMINKIFYGFNQNKAFLMLDFGQEFFQDITDISINFLIDEKDEYHIRFKKNKCYLASNISSNIEIAFQDILEIAIPIKLNQEFFIFKIFVKDVSSESILETYPIEGHYKIKIPTFHDYADFWYV